MASIRRSTEPSFKWRANSSRLAVTNACLPTSGCIAHFRTRPEVTIHRTRSDGWYASDWANTRRIFWQKGQENPSKNCWREVSGAVSRPRLSTRQRRNLPMKQLCNQPCIPTTLSSGEPRALRWPSQKETRLVYVQLNHSRTSAGYLGLVRSSPVCTFVNTDNLDTILSGPVVVSQSHPTWQLVLSARLSLAHWLTHTHCVQRGRSASCDSMRGMRIQGRSLSLAIIGTPVTRLRFQAALLLCSI